MTIKKPRIVIEQPEIGNLIRELRLLAGLTQEQFAAQLGVTYPTINRWENGRAKPSPLAMQRIEAMLMVRSKQGRDLILKYFSNKE